MKKLKQAMYREKAKIYDLIYHNKNYKKETEDIVKLIKKYKKSKGKDLVEFACGTGNYLKHLNKIYNCTGVDINEETLKIARKKVKNVVLKKGDMINLDLKKKFNIVLCLFSSINYVKSYSNLKKTIKNFSRHLKKGGVLIIDPFFNKSEYKQHFFFLQTYDGKKEKVARMSISKTNKNIAVLEFHFLYGTKKGIEYFVDVHELGFFDYKKILSIMRAEGLDAHFGKKKVFLKKRKVCCNKKII